MVGALIILYLTGFGIAMSICEQFEIKNSFAKTVLWPIWFIVELLLSVGKWMIEIKKEIYD